MNKKTVYKTWIRINKIITLSVISLFLILIALSPVNIFIRVLAGILSLPFLYTSIIVTYCYYQFSDIGGNFQYKIHNLIVSKISYTGNVKVLDIGVGSASLITKIAKSLPKASLIGIDYWGNDWEYSKNICEENAKCEGVSDQISFIKASASNLPFDDNEFDVAVSCLTFHEVKDENDKVKVFKESLRVIKKNGEFIFLDLFLDENVFGKNDEFFHTINSLGISSIKIEKLENIIDLPKILLNKKVLGNAVIISGRK
ncbi:class I SAM-dependent methyltransferase [Romboutsia lituseburensis]|uniref:Methyltransferase domain-containing protein n=1 Tax=Romboutsia lituseburensis DSM 797 TaxID=1121325 RepID=A0A1G9ITD6_9FIRM|nr:class I SAM-dependent methyltransferase [Romboutsia lituseburensis]CEH33769.1 Methyltransferase type 11 [Romboutsia lituseburensis]SDL28335.1 Methyltransferase domain-containing protein [Romboutsia lituseburensis DSM 797]